MNLEIFMIIYFYLQNQTIFFNFWEFFYSYLNLENCIFHDLLNSVMINSYHRYQKVLSFHLHLFVIILGLVFYNFPWVQFPLRCCGLFSSALVYCFMYYVHADCASLNEWDEKVGLTPFTIRMIIIVMRFNAIMGEIKVTNHFF